MYRPSICVIEDNDILRATLIDLLTSRQFQARGFFSLDEFLSTLSGPLPDIILADVLMEGGGGLELIDRLDAAGLQIPVILMSGSEEPDLSSRAHARGACAFLRKPFEVQYLFETLDRVRSDAVQATLFSR